MEQLLLKNPADNQSGFWVSYKYNGQLTRVSSTETECFSDVKTAPDGEKLIVTMDHTPLDSVERVMRFKIELWSFEKPMLFIKHTSTNMSKAPIEDLKLFNLMDFDLGGPTSYKDDMGAFDAKSGVMRVCDDTPLCVALTSRPTPDGWELSAPTKLRLTQTDRELKNNLELGPQDVATGLQWNLGNIDAGESKSVSLVITVGQNTEEADKLLPKAWEEFDTKIR